EGAVLAGEVVEDDVRGARIVKEVSAIGAEEAGQRVELVVAGIAARLRAVHPGDVLLRAFEADRDEVVTKKTLEHVGRALAVEIGRGIAERHALLKSEAEPLLLGGEGGEGKALELEHRLGLVAIGLELGNGGEGPFDVRQRAL